ncbi:MAG: hypothetical protein OXN15_03295 [Chloroflexota bacterium]|nr:hypothetical protein [Chloroflexota bacterium]MDE2969116.1 hypothetical protein [Chloroflexota bacterium]
MSHRTVEHGMLRLLAAALTLLALAACGTDDPPPAPVPVAEASSPTAVPLPAVPPTPAPVPATPTTAPPATDGFDIDAAVAGRTLVQLVDPLDEPEFYCVDVPGFGANLRLNAAMMAHTCKPGADDEIFALNEPGPGQLSMPAYDLCLEAGGAEAMSELFLRECSDSAMQRFALVEDGALMLTGTELCVAVAPGEGEPTGGPSHVRRDLMLLDCAEADPVLRQWSFPGPSPR